MILDTITPFAGTPLRFCFAKKEETLALAGERLKRLQKLTQ